MSSSSSSTSGMNTISNLYKTIQPCDRSISIFYLYILILVLILAGNIIQRGTKDKSMSWLAFSICVILGLLGMGLIFAGKHVRTIAVIAISVIIVAFLMFAMIYCDSDSTLTEKIGAHFANICFLIVVIYGLVTTRDSKMKQAIANACSSSDNSD